MKNFGKLFAKVDRVCGDLNVLLTVVAIGLGCLVMTMWITNIVVDETRRMHQLQALQRAPTTDYSQAFSAKVTQVPLTPAATSY